MNGNRGNGRQYSLRIGTAPPPLPPSCNKVTQSTSLNNCLSTFSFFPVSFFPLLLYILRENRTKL